ncbi:uncharacterized protein [Rutidosis leptorrhynchoides]|uniref:uncharacterized protein n=1 Tax=Rutidosis leptorrhynchoides TaxID=125765 RepID=UPI003A9A2D73
MAKKRANQTTSRSKTSPLSPLPSPISSLPFEDDKSPAPKSTILNKTTSRSKTSNKKAPIRATAQLDSSPLNTSSFHRSGNVNVSSVSDLKNLASSQLDDMKRNLIDRSHLEILKELESSVSRLHKRFKIQTQTSQQLMDEAEKDYAKLSERISESQEAMKASYAEFMTDAQASTSRLLKTSIPELSKSLEKAVDALQSRYGVRSA